MIVGIKITSQTRFSNLVVIKQISQSHIFSWIDLVIAKFEYQKYIMASTINGNGYS